MGKYGLTLGQKRPNFRAKRAQLQKPVIHSKQLPVKNPKNNTVYGSHLKTKNLAWSISQDRKAIVIKTLQNIVTLKPQKKLPKKSPNWRIVGKNLI